MKDFKCLPKMKAGGSVKEVVKKAKAPKAKTDAAPKKKATKTK